MEEAVAIVLNDLPASPEPGRQWDREVVETWEILEATEINDLVGLADLERSFYWGIVSAGLVNLKGPRVRALLARLFGAGTATGKNLAAMQTIPVSRATFLGQGRVRPGDVEKARAV